MDTQTAPIEILVENDYKGKRNWVTGGILDCIRFWNREGMMAVAKNRSGEWGNEETKEMANTMHADDFLLEMMLVDCNTFVNSDFAKNSTDTYECGRTRSHVWVHLNGERIFMIHTNRPV